MDPNTSNPIKVDPEILGGVPCFAGTRVPVDSLYDYLMGGESIDEFLKQFPSVKREQVDAVLALAKQDVLKRAYRVAG